MVQPEVAAHRALMLATMLQRLVLERTGGAFARAETQRLKAWADEHDLFLALGPDGLQLFELAPGDWSKEAQEAVSWTAEELHLLLWALQLAEAPAADARSDAAPLLMKVPLLQPLEKFSVEALRAETELVEAADHWERTLDGARSEVYARTLDEDPSAGEGDDELTELIAELAEEGFDASLGPAAALRFHLAHTLQLQRLEKLPDAALAQLLGIAEVRAGALHWLLRPDDEEEEQEEEETVTPPPQN
ncbi:MAG: DUF4272 domain-containing protein [Archangiaceae bacterium]|nr:DUF4272 domain-containing protein [Archangiaceae bacterium]